MPGLFFTFSGFLKDNLAPLKRAAPKVAGATKKKQIPDKSGPNPRSFTTIPTDLNLISAFQKTVSKINIGPIAPDFFERTLL